MVAVVMPVSAEMLAMSAWWPVVFVVGLTICALLSGQSMRVSRLKATLVVVALALALIVSLGERTFAVPFPCGDFWWWFVC